MLPTLYKSYNRSIIITFHTLPILAAFPGQLSVSWLLLFSYIFNTATFCGCVLYPPKNTYFISSETSQLLKIRALTFDYIYFTALLKCLKLLDELQTVSGLIRGQLGLQHVLVLVGLYK